MTTPSAAEALGADLRDEQDSLIDVLTGLDDDQWQLPSAATGWRIRDQIVHLAYFDGITALAGRAPDEFRRLRTAALEDLAAFIDGALQEKQQYTGAQLIDWWQVQRGELLETLLALPARISALEATSRRWQRPWSIASFQQMKTRPFQ